MNTGFAFASHSVLGGHQTQLEEPKAVAAQNPLIWGLMMMCLENGGRRTNWGVQSEHTSRKLPPDQHQGTCPAEKIDHQGTMNPRGPEMCLFVGSKNTSWCQSEQPI